jgi:hypothetical protein
VVIGGGKLQSSSRAGLFEAGAPGQPDRGAFDSSRRGSPEGAGRQDRRRFGVSIREQIAATLKPGLAVLAQGGDG